MSGRALRLILWAAIALVCLIAPAAATAAGPPFASATQIADVPRPTYITATPATPDLLYVVEQRGEIILLDNGTPVTRPFLDIRSLVKAVPEPGADTEQGLLSVAFPPDYATSGLFYVYFDNNDGDVEVDEFSVSASDPQVADRGSRRQVIVIPHQGATNHNGGNLQFGPTGNLLYFATGDGGAGQRANAADLDVLLGKLIRIDPRRQGAEPYRIPPTNPFVGRPGRDEIFAYGLRNPWRWSFDGSHVIIGDVGQSSWEEIDAVRLPNLGGVNFGWPQYEGNELFEPTLPGPDPVTFPVHTYGHAATGGCAITGGYVVHNRDLPGLKDSYLYADFCTGQIRRIRIDFSQEPPVASHDTKVGITLPDINTFGRGLDGQIYFARRTGEVYRLDPPAP